MIYGSKYTHAYHQHCNQFGSIFTWLTCTINFFCLCMYSFLLTRVVGTLSFIYLFLDGLLGTWRQFLSFCSLVRCYCYNWILSRKARCYKWLLSMNNNEWIGVSQCCKKSDIGHCSLPKKDDANTMLWVIILCFSTCNISYFTLRLQASPCLI